jgi:hypothetical protein
MGFPLLNAPYVDKHDDPQNGNHNEIQSSESESQIKISVTVVKDGFESKWRSPCGNCQ